MEVASALQWLASPFKYSIAAIPGYHASKNGRKALERHEENAQREVCLLTLSYIIITVVLFIAADLRGPGLLVSFLFMALI